LHRQGGAFGAASRAVNARSAEISVDATRQVLARRLRVREAQQRRL